MKKWMTCLIVLVGATLCVEAASWGGRSSSEKRGAGPGLRPQMERRSPGPQPGAPRLDPRRLAEAGVDDATIQKVVQLEYQTEQQRIDLEASLQKAELTLRHLMRGEDVEEKEVLAAADAVSDARAALFKLHVSTGLEIRQLLGEEILQELKQTRHARGEGEHRGPRS